MKNMKIGKSNLEARGGSFSAEEYHDSVSFNLRSRLDLQARIMLLLLLVIYIWMVALTSLRAGKMDKYKIIFQSTNGRNIHCAWYIFSKIERKKNERIGSSQRINSIK